MNGHALLPPTRNTETMRGVGGMGTEGIDWDSYFSYTFSWEKIFPLPLLDMRQSEKCQKCPQISDVF